MRMEAATVLCVVLLVVIHPTTSLVPASERQALVELFESTGGSRWTNRTGWLTGDPCVNRWFGIFCNTANTHVIEVFPNPRDSGNTLQGELPASFWTDLPELEHIYLSNDRPPGWSNLTGTLPDAVGSLTKLKCLYLSHAGKMTGTLPASMSNLEQLQGLFLRWTHFEGTLPNLSRARNLTKLIIDSSPLSNLCPPICKNKFVGTLDALASWKQPLAHLDVAGNKFTGVFPSALCEIKSCTAWGNEFSAPTRPKGCCAGLSGGGGGGETVAAAAGSETPTPSWYACHPHNFPSRRLSQRSILEILR